MRARQVGGMAFVIPLAEGECGEGLSGGLARIALEETAQTPSAVQFQWRIRFRGRSRGFSIRLDQGVADALVRSLRQIVRLELAQGLDEGLLPDEDKPLQAFALEGVDETLREGVEVRGMRRKPDRPDAGRPKDGVKLPRVLAVAVVDEMRRVPQRAVKAGDVPRLLRRPFRIRARRRAGDDDPARPDVDEEEDVVGDKPAGCPDVGGEEVRRPQTGVCPQKLRP